MSATVFCNSCLYSYDDVGRVKATKSLPLSDLDPEELLPNPIVTVDLDALSLRQKTR